MKQYHEHLEAILKYGTKKAPAREGMPGSISLFGYQNRYNLQKGFPILTTKKINFNNIVVELLWFLKGDTNIKYLVDNGCNIWNEDAYNYYCKASDREIGPDEFKYSFEEFIHHVKNSPSKYPAIAGSDYKFGDCGKQYGWLWKNWGENMSEYDENRSIHDFKGIDQIKNLIVGLESNPEGRRHIITAWNPATLDDMALNACHCFVQFNCRKIEIDHPLEEDKDDYNLPKYYLDCQMYQRSADMFLGVPYNISSYALLTEIIARICNMIPGDFIHTFGDSHIYDNHIQQVKEILSRDTEKYELPKLKISKNVSYDLEKYGLDESLKFIVPEDFELEGYQHYPTIKAKLSTGLK